MPRLRHFLKLLDHQPGELLDLLELARQLKGMRRSGQERPCLAGRAIALIFEKDSTRTRCAFEVAAAHLGASVSVLGSGSHFGKKETVADTARVLGRMYDAIAFRGYHQETVEVLAQFAGVPVFNALTDAYHPTQVLADFLTMQERGTGPWSQQSLVYLGDGSNNVACSLMVGSALLGLDFRLASPTALRPPQDLQERCLQLATSSGARLTFWDDPYAAVQNVAFVYTDVWVSMGEPEEVWRERVELLTPYRVTRELMAASGRQDTQFLHCLPAFHNRHTEVGAAVAERFGLDGIEVTEEVFESPRSLVFEQAENRLHTIKALLVAALR